MNGDVRADRVAVRVIDDHEFKELHHRELIARRLAVSALEASHYEHAPVLDERAVVSPTRPIKLGALCETADRPVGGGGRRAARARVDREDLGSRERTALCDPARDQRELLCTPELAHACFNARRVKITLLNEAVRRGEEANTRA